MEEVHLKLSMGDNSSRKQGIATSILMEVVHLKLSTGNNSSRKQGRATSILMEVVHLKLTMGVNRKQGMKTVPQCIFSRNEKNNHPFR